MDFVHLHTHSEYSLLDSTNTIRGLLEKAKDQEMQAIALTDHGNIRGAVEFYQEAQDLGIKPIIGCELYVAPESRHEKRGHNQGKEKYYHLVVLAKNNKGYENLVKLTSRA
ncbi:MAG: PHP domain-containing protein, partial [Candidatus Bipolaricaulia bacterium]